MLNWARKDGIIPDDMPWSDPVSGMRLTEAKSSRQPWELEELSSLFGSPIYVKGERPVGGKGEAAFWLPLLALFSDARLNELAPMCVEDVKLDTPSGVRFVTVIEDEEAGTGVKTEYSLRAAPVHSELVRMASWSSSSKRARLADCRLASSRSSPQAPRAASVKRSQSGSVATSVTSVSTTQAACFIRFAMASRTPCALLA